MVGRLVRLAYRLIRNDVARASGGFSHHTETIAERIAAKCDGWARTTFKFLFTFRASVHCLCQKGFKIVDLKVDMNWRPVSLIAANFVGSLAGLLPADFSINPI